VTATSAEPAHAQPTATAVSKSTSVIVAATPTSGPVTAEPSVTWTPTVAPTETTVPSVEELSITQNIIGEFALAAGVDAAELAKSLQTEAYSLDGKQYQVVFVSFDANPNDKEDNLNGKWPLMVKEEDGVWSSDLKDIFRAGGMRIGSSIARSYSVPGITESDIDRLLSGQASMGLLTLYWPNTEKTQGKVELSSRTRRADFAKTYDMNTIGNLVLWGKDVPPWVKNGNFNKQQLTDIIKKRVRDVITTMVPHGVTSYIVVNEAGSDDIFWNTIGPDYVEIAYQAARDVGKEIGVPLTLLYNDYDNLTKDQPRTAQTAKVVSKLKAKGLVDKVGVEAITTFGDNPSVEAMVSNLKSYGLPVVITESAVIMTGVGGSDLARAMKQAGRYYNLISAAARVNCSDFIVFEFLDPMSPWENEKTLYGYSLKADPGIFDVSGRKIMSKLSRFAIQKAIIENRVKTAEAG